MKDQEPGFAYHKHEQSIITALAYYDKTVCMIPETYEKYAPDTFAWASRCRAANFWEYLPWAIKMRMRHLLGDETFEKGKKLLGIR